MQYTLKVFSLKFMIFLALKLSRLGIKYKVLVKYQLQLPVSVI